MFFCFQISDNDGVQLTNREIRLKSIRAAKHFIEMGFGKDDVFGFVAKNTYHLAPIVFGSLIIGAAVNPLDPSYKKGNTQTLKARSIDISM